jgi:alkylhydroperoxidase family enzyme
MATPTGSNDKISSKVEIEYPDFTKLPDHVREKFEKLPTKVNFFRMLGYSPGAFVPMIDLTNAIFRDLTISDYHKELMVLLLAAHENVAYEWEQHVSIAQAAGVRPDQFVAIAEGCLEDTEAFTEEERVLLRFGQAILDKGKAPGVLFKHALEHFSLQELSDAIIVIGYYRMLSGYIQTFDIAIDAQEDGNWIKG